MMEYQYDRNYHLLLEKFLADRLNEEETKEFLALLESDPAIGRDVYTHSFFHYRLKKAAEVDLDLPSLSTQTRFIADHEKRRRIKIAFGIACSLLIVLTSLFFLAPSIALTSRPSEEAALGRVKRSNAPLWNGDMKNLRGLVLRQGKIQQESGETELVFFSGFRLVLEQQAEMRILEDKHLECQNGVFHVFIPLGTPTIFIDIPGGTLQSDDALFSIRVNPARTEIHLREGSLQVVSPQKPHRILQDISVGTGICLENNGNIVTFPVDCSPVESMYFTEGASIRIANRGYSAVAPENTLVAIRKALAAKADACRLDIRAAKDGTLYLSRYDDLSRVTGRNLHLSDLLPEQINQLDVGFRFSPSFGGQRIPKLEEALSLFRGTDCIPVLNIASEDVLSRLFQTIREFDSSAKFIVMSDSPSVLAAVRKYDQTVVLCYNDSSISGESPESIASSIADLATRSGVSIICTSNVIHSTKVLDLLHSRGFAVWTHQTGNFVDTQNLLRMNIDGIISDLSVVKDPYVRY